MSKQYPIARQQDPILRQHPVADHVEDVVPPSPGRPANFRRKSNILSVAVSAIVIPGLLATVALPAYAATGGTTRTERAHIALAQTVHDHAQTLYVSAAEDVTDNVDRGAFGYVAPPAPVVHRVTLAQFGSGGPVPSNLSGAAAVAAPVPRGSLCVRWRESGRLRLLRPRRLRVRAVRHLVAALIDAAGGDGNQDPVLAGAARRRRRHARRLARRHLHRRVGA